MVTAIRPVSMTVLPPAPLERGRRAVSAPVEPLTGVLRPLGVGDEDRFVRTVEGLGRVGRDGASGQAGFQIGAAAREAGDRGVGLPLEADALILLHGFSETRGLTLNRHPEAAQAYHRTQALTQGPLTQGGDAGVRVSA